MIALLAPVLLAALVVTDTVTAHADPAVATRLAGVLAAAVALLLRATMLTAVAVAVATTVVLRLLF